MKRILLVDDSKTALFMERMVLKNGPYEILTASDGLEAVERALRDHPDLILMDVIMPRMNGFEALRAMRQSVEAKNTPVILVTTRSESHSVEEGYLSGCTDYLTKPFEAAELLAKVGSYLGA